MIRLTFYSLLFIATLCTLSLLGCKKNKDSDYPALPPSTSMDMEGLKTFGSKKKSLLGTGDSTNFNKAWKLVHNWDSISTSIVLIPKLIFLEALAGKDPVYDNATLEWTWTYTKTIAGNGSYLAILTGKEANDSMFWTMKVSLIGGDGISDFKWYEGQSDLKQTGGWWKIYEPMDKNAYLLINWNKKSENIRWIQYTNIINAGCDKKCFIKYGLVEAADYDAYFDIYDNSPPDSTKIEWNTVTSAGRIINSGWIYGWDNNLQSLSPVQTNE